MDEETVALVTSSFVSLLLQSPVNPLQITIAQ